LRHHWDSNENLVELKLEPRPGVRVRVVMPAGWKPSRLGVRIGIGDEFARSNFLRLKLRLKQARGSDREFLIHDVSPGRYVVAASIDGRVADVHTTIDIRSELTRCELRIERYERPNTRLVQLTGPGGVPVDDARFGFRYSGPNGLGGSSGRLAPRLGPGLYAFSIETLEKQAKYTLSVRSAAYGKIEAPLRLDTGDELKLEFEEPAYVVVQIERYAGSPHAGYLRASLSAATRTPNPDTHGIQVFQPMQPGEHSLILKTTDSPMVVLSTRTVTVRPGQNRISIEIPQLVSVRIAREKPATDLREHTIELRRADPDAPMFRRHVELKGDRTIAVSRLLPGTYTITGSTGGKPWTRTVAVPSRTTLRVP